MPVGELHRVQDRLDHPNPAVAGAAWPEVRLLALEADHHADRQSVVERDGADGIQRIHQARLLHEKEGADPAIGHRGADRDALVFLADPDQAEVRIPRDRPEQAVARHEIGNRDHEADLRGLEGGQDSGAVGPRHGRGLPR